jgi:hypothetical protein
MLDVEVSQILQWQTPFPVAAFLVALWLRPSVPGWAAVTLGMAIAWLLSIIWSVHAIRARYAAYRKDDCPAITFTLGDDQIRWASEGFSAGWMSWDGTTIREQGGVFVVNDGITDIGFLPRRYLSQEEIDILTKRQHSHRG